MKKYNDNPELQTVWRLINQTSTNVFLTGKAGTGKTTFLKELKEHGRKKMIVVAPTGVAAINACGTTIHSMFQLPFAPYIPGKNDLPHGAFRMSSKKRKLLRNIELLVVDEISMVRADVLDLMDLILRFYRHSKLPFGGVQLLLIGDLHQLAPVVTAGEEEILSQHYPSFFFFESDALKRSVFTTVILNKVYRQTDQKFLDILDKIRQCNISSNELRLLNERYVPDFNLYENNNSVRLMTHVNQALEINLHFLSLLNGEIARFECKVTGNYPENSYPNEKVLELKVGARVMFVKNDESREKNYYNGMLGTLEKIETATDSLWVRNDENKLIEVRKTVWDYATYSVDSDTNEIIENKEGTFEQYPIRLAWAITIHKSQGLTFDNVIINASRSFTHGQTYVALSRCRNLGGITLTKPILQHHLKKSEIVDEFETYSEENKADEQQIQRWEADFLYKTYDQLFDLEALKFCFEQLLQRCQNSLFDNESLGKLLRPYTEFFNKVSGSSLSSFDEAVQQYQEYRHEIRTGHIEHTDNKFRDVSTKTAKACSKILLVLQKLVKKPEWLRQKYEFLAEQDQTIFDLMDDFENLIEEKLCSIEYLLQKKV